MICIEFVGVNRFFFLSSFFLSFFLGVYGVVRLDEEGQEDPEIEIVQVVLQKKAAYHVLAML